MQTSIRRRIFEIVEVADQDDRSSRIYDLLMMAMILMSMVPMIFKQQAIALLLIEKITVSAFILDYLLRWLTADMKFGKVAAFLTYPFSGWAIIDLLAILPSLALLPTGFKLLKIFRLFRALRVLKFLRYSKSFGVIIAVLRKEKRSLLAVCSMAVGYIIITALLIFTVEPDSFATFFDAVYWATVALTTVGYGDIYPVSVIGRIVGMISSLMGIAIVALPAGIITAGYMTEINDRNQ